MIKMILGVWPWKCDYLLREGSSLWHRLKLSRWDAEMAQGPQESTGYMAWTAKVAPSNIHTTPWLSWYGEWWDFMWLFFEAPRDRIILGRTIQRCFQLEVQSLTCPNMPNSGATSTTKMGCSRCSHSPQTPSYCTVARFDELYMVMEICDSDLKKLCRTDLGGRSSATRFTRAYWNGWLP